MLELFQEQKQKKISSSEINTVRQYCVTFMTEWATTNRQCCVFCGNLIIIFFFSFFFFFFSIGQVWFFLPGINISGRNRIHQSNVYLSQTTYNCKQD